MLRSLGVIYSSVTKRETYVSFHSQTRVRRGNLSVSLASDRLVPNLISLLWFRPAVGSNLEFRVQYRSVRAVKGRLSGPCKQPNNVHNIVYQSVFPVRHVAETARTTTRRGLVWERQVVFPAAMTYHCVSMGFQFRNDAPVT